MYFTDNSKSLTVALLTVSPKEGERYKAESDIRHAFHHKDMSIKVAEMVSILHVD